MESVDGELTAAGIDSVEAGFDSVFVSVLDSDFESLPLSDFVSALVSPGLLVAPLA